MGIQRFQIIFDNNKYGVYYAGQTITGHVILCLDSEQKIEEISMKFKGFASVYWTEKRTERNSDGTTRTETESYSNSEIYFDNQMLLYGKGDSTTLTVGEHRFPFSFILPNNLPASFEGEYGYVRYSAMAILDIPWKFNKEAKVVFTIISPLDLNERPELNERLCTNKEKTFCCLCCASGPLMISFSIPVGGAVSGETIFTDIEVENTSNVKVNNISLVFQRVVTFRAISSSRASRNIITEKSLGAVNSRRTRHWNKQQIKIPALPPSNLSNCNIIDLEYSIEVVAKPSGAHKNLELSLPLLIGTIPFQQRFNPIPSAPSMGFVTDKTTPDLPPPVYEESVFGRTNTRENDNIYENADFAPRYPVYTYLGTL